MYLCTPLECICARVRYDSADAHTCGRVRVPMTRLCTACARGRRGRCHHVRACVCLPVYIANAHVMYIIYVYVYRCKVRVCKWVRMCVLAYACDRVRALTMREYAACVRVRRAHFVTPRWTRSGIVYRDMLHACIYIHARLATHMNASSMRARRTHAATSAPMCARTCACMLRRTRIRAD
jgi:hypothetical protein